MIFFFFLGGGLMSPKVSERNIHGRGGDTLKYKTIWINYPTILLN